MTAATAFPLTWPPAFPRTKVREKGAFKTTLAGALSNVEGSLRRFAADSGKKLDGVVMSSNVTLGVQRPADPGVAVWFTWDGMGICVAVDRYPPELRERFSNNHRLTDAVVRLAAIGR